MTLLLERLYPYESGFLYIDFITGRQVVIESTDSASLIFPSRIFVSNTLFKVSKEEILQKSFDILDNDELNYLNISEDILYNSAFCEIISKRDNTRTIPISLVKEEIKTKIDEESIQSISLRIKQGSAHGGCLGTWSRRRT